MNEVKTLNDKELISSTKTLRAKEKEILHQLLLHLGEIDERKLYRNEGYSSFFSYLQIGLGYSESAAYRRVEGARFLRKRPELYKELESGTLTFSSLVELSKCREKENLEEIVEESKGKPLTLVKEHVAREVAPIVPEKRREKIRAIKFEGSATSEPTSAAEVNYEISFQADEEFMKMYREAKAVAGGFSMGEVFKRVLRDYTKRKSPKERMRRRAEKLSRDCRKPSLKLRPASGRVSSETSSKSQRFLAMTTGEKRTRYIPAATRDEVFVRDKGRCTYVSDDGVRCSETHCLEVDHIHPFSLGGEHVQENLRLLCRAHNQLEAERVLGKKFVM